MTTAPQVRRAFPLVSVVVVTYNNVGLTRACLRRLAEVTEWPNYETVIVDNGSSDSTPDFLRALAAAHPRTTLILNSDNRGFASANNQGLAEVSGDYLVLLNNDT